MNVFLTFLLSQSILIPIGAGLVRIKRIATNWLPFLTLLALAFIAELISFIIIHFFNLGNAPVIKVYSLLECCLIFSQFYKWTNFKNEKKMLLLLTGACLAVWITENIIFLKINTFSPYFRVFYAFIIVLLSINHINAIIVRHGGHLLKNPWFIICLSFIIFFTYQIIYEASFFIGDDQSVVANKIILGFGYINLIINIFYSVAILLISSQDYFSTKKYYSKH